MNGLYSCIIALSMYSKIPMPTVEWTEERMRYVMVFFPLVGIAEGAVMWLFLYAVLDILEVSTVTAAFVGAAVPVLVTGGIHMDGFLDTCDALHSYGERSRKLEILSDPHLGAFAVISFSVYMMLYIGVLHEYLTIVVTEGKIYRYILYMVPGLVFVMERAFSGLSVVTFSKAKKEGLAARFGGAAERTDRAVLVLWVLGCLAAGAAAMAAGYRGAAVMAVGLLLVDSVFFFWYYRMSSRQFGGVTGDLAGCFLQVCELGGLVLAVVLAKAGMMGGM